MIVVDVWKEDGAFESARWCPPGERTFSVAGEQEQGQGDQASCQEGPAPQ